MELDQPASWHTGLGAPALGPASLHLSYLALWLESPGLCLLEFMEACLEEAVATLGDSCKERAFIAREICVRVGGERLEEPCLFTALP